MSGNKGAIGRIEDIHEQWKRLAISRKKLADVLNQIALQGEAFALPWQISTCREARAEIARIKAVLRGWGETVDDHLDNLDLNAPSPYPSSLAPTTPIEALGQTFPISFRPQVRSMLETYTEIFGGRAVREVATCWP